MRNILDKIIVFFKNNKKTVLKILAFASGFVALAFLFVLTLNLIIVSQTNDNVYSPDEMIKISDDFDCILILGAGVKKDGSPTDMLYDRLAVAYQAYESGKSPVLFVTGDSENNDYTETVTMERVLCEMGVDKSAIISDGYGLSTYESLWRAKNVYGYKRVLIVTQEYHLYRAIYIAKKLGLEAYGLDGAIRNYGKQPIYSFREYFARIKDMIFAEMQPMPTYLEKWEAPHE